MKHTNLKMLLNILNVGVIILLASISLGTFLFALYAWVMHD